MLQTTRELWHEIVNVTVQALGSHTHMHATHPCMGRAHFALAYVKPYAHAC